MVRTLVAGAVMSAPKAATKAVAGKTIARPVASKTARKSGDRR
jgi:hypothetical protein